MPNLYSVAKDLLALAIVFIWSLCALANITTNNADVATNHANDITTNYTSANNVADVATNQSGGITANSASEVTTNYTSAETTSFHSFILGSETSFFRNSEDKQDISNGLTFGYGLQQPQWSVWGEFTATRISEAKYQSLQIDREHFDLLIWGHYHLLPNARFMPYVGFGLGTNWEIIETNLVGIRETHQSVNSLAYGIDGGVWGTIWKKLSGGFEGRLLSGQGYYSSPTLSILVKVGFTL